MIEVSDVYKSFTLKDKRTLKIKTIAAVRGILSGSAWRDIRTSGP